jgi:arginase
MSYRILCVATNLGLRPGGVERLGEVLLKLGLAERVGAAIEPVLLAPPFDKAINADVGARNVQVVAELAVLQADRVAAILRAGDFPVVLGGDDSVLFGCLLALRRMGAAGLYLLDGHTDFWNPRKGCGELSDSDLWIATGRGVPAICNLEDRGPFVDDRACVVYGHRDRTFQIEQASDDVYTTPMLVRNLAEVRAAGIQDAARHAAAFLKASGVARVWLHLDADCLSDDIMPAVDWRVAGGFTANEVIGLARPLVASGLIAGMDVTIYNPGLDSADFQAGNVLCAAVAAILE